jgi:hypothetical protein
LILACTGSVWTGVVIQGFLKDRKTWNVKRRKANSIRC